MTENQVTRDNLKEQVKEIRQHLSKLPESALENLKEAFPNVVADMETVETQLLKNECVILVAGE